MSSRATRRRSARFCTTRRVAAVSCVGSTPIAHYIYRTAAESGKRVQALGGTKNHMVVMPDADLDQVTDALMGAAYG
jgi:malonate-semialdehyde dehydrogenase (acetylating) / methylmalonate-semialdehyde dehydrogenase